MAGKQKTEINKIYLSDRLRAIIAQSEAYPVTVIEAPLGFGKTEAMRFYLREEQVSHVWMTVSEGSAESFWKQFCSVFSRIDRDIGMELDKNGFSSDRSRMMASVRMISQFSSERPVFFVIDDYHLVLSPGIDRFFELIARENTENLHFVLMGRHWFNSCREELQLKGFLYIITEDDLRLTREECGWYFESQGILLTVAQAEQICSEAEGWISALFFILEEYRNPERISAENRISSLLEGSLYSEYSEDRKDFLLRVSIFDEFTKEQARFVRRKADPSRILDTVTATGGLIRFDAKEKTYHMHNMFSRFLREKLEEQPREYITEVYRHGGDWYYLNRQYHFAIYYYYRSGDYNEMLKAFERDKGSSLSGRNHYKILRAFEECPAAIRSRHPVANLLFARQLCLMGESERLKKVIKELRVYFETESLSESRRREMYGEYFMLLSSLSQNHLEKMIFWQQKASRHLPRPSLIEGAGCTFTGGSPSILCMFYRQPSGADRLAERMHDSRPLHNRLTDRKGSGAEYLLEAEIEYNRGNFQRSEILSWRAHLLAREAKQTEILICALFLQARIALLRGESEKGRELTEEIRRTANRSGKVLLKDMSEICISFIYAAFHQTDHLPEWIYEGDFAGSGLYRPAWSFGYIVYGRILTERGQYARYLGEIDRLAEYARASSAVLTEIYLYIYAAVSCSEMKMEEEADRWIAEAFRLAADDGFCLPFAENGQKLMPVLKRWKYEGEYSSFVRQVIKVFAKRGENLSFCAEDAETALISVLTEREQKIALLVAQGRTNGQIAEELSIAEITVKKSLSGIYSRLGLKNRAALAKHISSVRS